MHVRAMKTNFKLFLHVASMYSLQFLIRENIGHACIFIVHDGFSKGGNGNRNNPTMTGVSGG